MSVPIEDAFERKQTVFLDSAPVIHALGSSSDWFQKATAAIRHCIERKVCLPASPVTLAECLAGGTDPLKGRNIVNFLLWTPEIDFQPIDDVVAIQAGLLRQRRGWRLADSLQMAFALRYGCDAFLTNDAGFANAGLAIETILPSNLA